MQGMNRRQFMGALLSVSATTLCPTRIARAAQQRVIVVGGGFAGATAAKYLRLWSNNTIEVVLIAPESAHTSCILSNLAITGQIPLSNITFSYDVLAAKYGIQFVQDRVISITPALQGGSILLGSGRSLSYDRLVLAPGVSFDPVPGLEADAMRSDSIKLVPHAWIAGQQTINLSQQLSALPKRGTFVLTIPPKPYRCPPGPYERACVIADYMKRRKNGGALFVLDANPGIVAEPVNFSNAFQNLYPGLVRYIPSATLRRVEFQNGPQGRLQRVAVFSQNGSLTEQRIVCDVLNVLPVHKAGNILFQDGLGLIPVGSRWAPVDPTTYESTTLKGIHIIGDSQGTGQPKAGHIANGEAKICTDAIIRMFQGITPHQSPVTNSNCFSPVTSNSASWLSSSFRFDPLTRTMQTIPEASGESPGWSGDHFQTMFGWAENLFSDTFL